MNTTYCIVLDEAYMEVVHSSDRCREQIVEFLYVTAIAMIHVSYVI
jgi:hypothetical protein